VNEAIREWVRTILRLPRGNPSLPTTDPAELRVVNPSPDYLRYSLLWYWVGLATAGPIVLLSEIGGLVAAAASKEALLSVVLLVGSVLLVLLTLGGFWFRYFTVTLEVEMLRYTFSERAMRLRRGVMHLEEVTISYANIQNIRFLQGPIQRIYKIADLVVDTAGGGSRMAGGNPEMEGFTGHRGLIKGVADPAGLRDWLLARMRQCRGAGLGDGTDVHADPAGHSLVIESLPPAFGKHLAAIRDELRAANAAIVAGRVQDRD